jgi:3-hydroxy-9,10-secoandrosta-1,3,5(10)-triene-9,17-dione monooxygenase
VTPDALIERARQLVPVLRERQAECEALGRIPDVSNDAFVEAGFYRILQPRRFGGLEYDMPTFARVMMEVARGCPSSAWVLALTAGHAIMFSAFFSEQAQVEVYGESGEFRAPSSTRASAPARPVDGGYMVSAEWDYASGIDVSTHVIAGISVPVGEAFEPRMAILDRTDYSIVDNWHVIGMQGTGSRRVVAHEVFVPEYRVIVPPRDAFSARNAPGRGVHANPMFVAGRLTSVLLEEMAAVAVGTAQGALEVYADELCRNKLRYPPFTPRSQVAEYQRHFGEAWALIRVAESTVLDVAEQYMEFARQDAVEGVPFSDERDQQLQLLEQHATRLAAEAVDLMFRTAGTHVAQRDSPLQRYFRDMSVIKTHAAAQYDRGAEALGRIHFTGELAPPGVLQQTPL